MRNVIACLAVVLLSGRECAEEIVLAANREARVAIVVPSRLMDDAKKNPEPALDWRSLKVEDQRRRLRESVKDLAAISERITGAKFEIVNHALPVGDKRLPILIGELAHEPFGKPQKDFT